MSVDVDIDVLDVEVTLVFCSRLIGIQVRINIKESKIRLVAAVPANYLPAAFQASPACMARQANKSDHWCDLFPASSLIGETANATGIAIPAKNGLAQPVSMLGARMHSPSMHGRSRPTPHGVTIRNWARLEQSAALSCRSSYRIAMQRRHC